MKLRFIPKFSIRAINVVVTAACLGMIGLAMLFTYWLFWPYQTIQYRQLPIPVFTEVPTNLDTLPVKTQLPIFKPGSRVVLIHDYCKLTDTPVTGTLELIDSVKLSIPFEPAQSEVGCQKRAALGVTIPEFFRSEEPVVFHFTLNYKVNPIRTITYHLESEPFFVRE